ncbi:hypothetical protein B9Z55_008514 [Caenorhabditis nigoni]|uniref:Uncharacterized protein n=1 Tax=Caenorhabditis nigoni TaxID=1611254 RepID=A0A2G5UN20_9PELO|nr:hypothetical protein B9Z55_008514 [Caenorhabditis nigoni]
MKIIESIQLSDTVDVFEQLFAWYLENQCPNKDCSAVYNRASKGCQERRYDQDPCGQGLKQSLDLYCNMDGGDKIKMCEGHRTTTTAITTTAQPFPKAMIVGVAVGGIIFLGILVGVVIYCIKKHKKAKNNMNNSGTTTAGTTNMSTATGGKTKVTTRTRTGTGTTTKKNANTGVGVTARY